MTESDALARVVALLAEMDAEANDYSARHDTDDYDRGADDQLDTDRRRLRTALLTIPVSDSTPEAGMPP